MDFNNPANPINPCNPISPLNPNNIYHRSTSKQVNMNWSEAYPLYAGISLLVIAIIVAAVVWYFSD